MYSVAEPPFFFFVAPPEIRFSSDFTVKQTILLHLYNVVMLVQIILTAIMTTVLDFGV